VTSAWDAKDSWVTNLTAVGTVLTGIFTQSAISTFVPGVERDGFTVMSLLFGGAAVMGPVVYGAFARRPLPGATTPTGTRLGFLAASVVTLFAAFGLLSDLGLLMSDSVATAAEKGLIDAGLALAAVLIGCYAIRSTIVVLQPASASGEARRAGSSLLSPASRASGTL